MKKNVLVWILFALIGGLFVVACDDNDDDDYIYQSIVTVTVDQAATGNSFYLTTEKGNKLTPDNQSQWLTDIANGKRAVAYFTIKSGSAPSYTIDLLALKPILTKSVWVMDTANVDSIVVAKKYPGPILEAWYQGGYINIFFRYYWVDAPVYVNLVKSEVTFVTSGGETDTIASTTPNPTGGVLSLEFIVNLNNRWILPPQWTNSIASFAIPADVASIAGVTTIKILYYDRNANPQYYTLPVNQTSSNFYKSELIKNSDGMNVKTLME
ncbi:MAG: hypothetical protein Q4F97_10150 [Bacteroidales bacterium]|nr:hypothetical protein [Bacteroidales bacterium]